MSKILLNKPALWMTILLLFSIDNLMAATMKIACIGDSITQGSGLANAAVNAYPVVLGRLLGTNFTVRNFGVSGRTLLKKGDYPYWKETMFRDATNFAPNIVTIKLGTNDSKPQNWKYKNEFANDLRDMVGVFSNLPSQPKVYLCLPVPAHSVTFDINPDIIRNEVIPIIKQVAKEKGIQTIDLYTSLSGKQELFPDDIHPNDIGASLIARTIHSAIISELTE